MRIFKKMFYQKDRKIDLFLSISIIIVLFLILLLGVFFFFQTREDQQEEKKDMIETTTTPEELDDSANSIIINNPTNGKVYNFNEEFHIRLGWSLEKDKGLQIKGTVINNGDTSYKNVEFDLKAYIDKNGEQVIENEIFSLPKVKAKDGDQVYVYLEEANKQNAVEKIKITLTNKDSL